MAVREVCKGSWLQQKIRMTSKPLKKADCLPEQWFVFCVHDDRVPLLEIYLSEKEVSSHRPAKVIDLLNCSYISRSIDDDKSFVIGFKPESGRNILEFAALAEDVRNEWVNILTFKLQQTGHLEINSNIYSPLPCLDIPQSSAIPPPAPTVPPLSISPRSTSVEDASPRNSTNNNQLSGLHPISSNQNSESAQSSDVDPNTTERNIYETPRRSSSRSSTRDVTLNSTDY